MKTRLGQTTDIDFNGVEINYEDGELPVIINASNEAYPSKEICKHVSQKGFRCLYFATEHFGYCQKHN